MYFAGIIDEAARNSFGLQQASWLHTLARDHANLRSALEFSLSPQGDAALGLRTASGAWFYWAACGQLLEGRLWLDRALERSAVPSVERCQALWASAFICVLQGEHGEAVERADEAIGAARDIGDARSLAAALHVRGLAALFSGDLSLARARFDDATLGYRSLGVDSGLAVLLLVHRGLVALFDDQLGEATTLVDEARQLCLAKGEQWVLSYGLQASAMIEFVRGDLASTSSLVAQSLALKRTLRDTLGIAIGMDMLSWVAAAELRFERAAVLMGAAHRVWGGVGEPAFGSKNFAALRNRAEESVRRHAESGVYADGYERGSGLDLDQAIGFALDEPEPANADSDRVDPAIGLTRRESEVAELVAQGMSNKEIAAALVISQRTAEGHVQRILTKFGFTSRAQVATWVVNKRASQGV
jgi:non-specific serine/threonine protein kinase